MHNNKNEVETVAGTKPAEDWMARRWRPAMGWTYMVICLLDMAVFPVLWSILQAVLKQPVTQWDPLTLRGAGLFHIAMGAVLGIAAFGRTQEKVAGASTATTTVPSSAPSFSPAPTPAFTPAPSFSAPSYTPAPAFTPAPSFNAPVITSSTGKPAPVQPEHPEL